MPGEPVSFESAVERFAEQHVSRKTGRPFSAASQQNVRDNLLGGPMAAFRRQRGISTIDAWSGDLAAEYLHRLQHELRRDSATIKKVRGQLRSFGEFCDQHLGTRDAAAGSLTTIEISPATDFEDTQNQALTHREADAVLKAASTGRDRAIISMLLYTGMRPSELLALDTQHVRLDRNPPVFEIRGSVHGADLTKRRTATRDVPLTVGQTMLPGVIRDHLAGPRRPPNATRLFLSHRRDHHGRQQPLTLEGLKSMLAKLGEDTGIRCNAYRFRHTFCTWCAAAGMQMAHLQQLLGLASGDMIAEYYRGTTSDAAVVAAARIRF